MKQDLEEKMIIFTLAALFRAAGLCRAGDHGSSEADRDGLAIQQAKRFIKHSKDQGIWPNEEPRGRDA
jgi:hypothetical protein